MAACLAGLVVGLLVLRHGTAVLDEARRAPAPAQDPEIAIGPSAAGGAEEVATEPEDVGPERAAEPGDSDEEPDTARGLRVLVVDALTWRPLEGAEVVALGRAEGAARRTAADGTCRVPLRDAADAPELRVAAQEHATRHVEGPYAGSVVVPLARATRLTGRVLDAATLAPLPGARVRLAGEAQVGEEAVADATGRYRLAGVPVLAAAELEVRARGFATQTIAFELVRDVPEVEQDLLLVGGMELAGRVEDWTSGLGIAGARIDGLVTDERGGFAGLVRPTAGTTWAQLEVAAEGYATLYAELDLAVAGEPVFRLPRPAELAGEVRDADGPVAGARVAFGAHGPPPGGGETSPLYELPRGWRYALEDATAESDADGRYVLAVLPWAIDGVVRLDVRGACEQETAVARTGEPGSTRRIDWWTGACPRESRVRGQVRLNGQERELDLTGFVAWRGPTRAGKAVLDDGAFDALVEPGEVTLVATLDLAPGSPSPEVVLGIEAGETRTTVLDVVAPVRPITGRVVTRGGAPVPDTTVYALSVLSSDRWRWGPLFRARTDARGAFELAVADLGLAYELSTLGFDGRWSAEDLVPPGARDVELVIAGGGELRVRVTDARTGAVLRAGADVQLVARPAGGRFGALQRTAELPDAAGYSTFRTTARELELVALPRAHLAGLGSRGTRVVLDDAGRVDVELALPRGVVLELALAADADPWPVGYQVLVVEEELAGEVEVPRGRAVQPLDELALQRGVAFDADGRARVSGLAPGAYRLRAFPGDVAVEPERVEVSAGGSATLAVRWHARQ